MILTELIAVLPQLRQMLLAGKSRQVTVHDEHQPPTPVILQTVHLVSCVGGREPWSRLAFQIRHVAAHLSEELLAPECLTVRRAVGGHTDTTIILVKDVDTVAWRIHPNLHHLRRRTLAHRDILRDRRRHMTHRPVVGHPPRMSTC